MRYHTAAFFLGFVLDLIFGDPYWLPHPVRLIGKLIAAAEGWLRRESMGRGKSDRERSDRKKADRERSDREKPDRERSDSENADRKNADKEKSDRKKAYRENTDRERSDRKHIDETESDRTGADRKKELRQGVGLVLIVLASVTTAALLLLLAAYRLHPYAGLVVESLMTYQILAARCLKVESMKVCRCLRDGDLEQARRAVSMIVGRDTEDLSEEGVARAAIETVAENTSDGVIAPMLYLAAGGPVLGFLYKAVNTMDSMVGYKNDRYLYFGRAAARLDDAVNFLPARISACLMIAASFLLGSEFSGKGAYEIYRRDRRKHASPNSAQTESVCAGALGIRLAGNASYFGRVVKKPYIGEERRRVECEDIRRANRLMYAAAWMCEALCVLLLTYSVLLSR